MATQTEFCATAAFFESEAEERALRASLQLAQVFFYESAEFAEIQAGTRAAVRRFLAEALPRPVRDLDFKTDLFATVVAAVAEDVTTRALPRAQVRRFASQTADMLCRQVGL